MELMDELDHRAAGTTGTSCRSSRRRSRETARHRTSPKPGSRASCTTTISRQANAASGSHQRPGLSTEPDWLHEPTKVAVYLDGMSRALHGDPKTAQRDQLIRGMLELDGYTVIVVQSRDLNDPQAVRQHLRNIAQAIGRDRPAGFQARQRRPLDPPATAESRPRRLGRAAGVLRRAVPGLGAGLRRARRPLPDVGYELQDEQGRVCAEAELAWPSKKVAVLLPEQAGSGGGISRAQGWKVFSTEDEQQTTPRRLDGVNHAHRGPRQRFP